jgi:hypothetical protein
LGTLSVSPPWFPTCKLSGHHYGFHLNMSSHSGQLALCDFRCDCSPASQMVSCCTRQPTNKQASKGLALKAGDPSSLAYGEKTSSSQVPHPRSLSWLTSTLSLLAFDSSGEQRAQT